VPEEVGLPVEHFCCPGHKEAVDDGGGVFPAGGQIPEDPNKEDSCPSFDN
jgi:hypothetical protein